MATFNMQSGATVGVGANKISALPARNNTQTAYFLEEYLDFSKVYSNGVTCTNGDIFQLLNVPANCVMLFGGAEVMEAVDGTTPTVDIDFAAGDDIIDGGDVTSLGYLASGANGQTNIVNTGTANTFTAFISADDTIDVKLIAASADVTKGVIRVYAWIFPVDAFGTDMPTTAVRDQLA